MTGLLKPLLLIVVGLAVGAAGMFGASKAFGSAGAGNHGVQAPASPVGILYLAKERVVNLADSGALRYIKIALALEIEDPSLKGALPRGDEYRRRQEELAKELRPFTPLLDDQITTVLAAKTVSQLTTPDGKEQLRQELLEQFNKVLPEHRVLNVYYTEFVIQ